MEEGAGEVGRAWNLRALKPPRHGRPGTRITGLRQGVCQSPKLMPSSRAVSIVSQSSGTVFIRLIALDRGT